MLRLVRNTMRYFSSTNSYKEPWALKKLPWPLLTASQHGCSWWPGEKWGRTCLFHLSTSVPALQFVAVQQYWTPPTCNISPSSEEAENKSKFTSCVYSTLSLGYAGSTDLCNLASCRGRWFVNRWHPLLEENAEKILLLKTHKQDYLLQEKQGNFFRLLLCRCYLPIGTTRSLCL